MKNKNVLLLTLVLLVAAFFTATQPITPQLAFVSSVSVIIFALPAYWAIVKAQGKQKGLLTIGLLGLYALIIESSAIHTGFPYGNFTYTDVLGTKIFGLTPWTVAFAYPPILILAYWYARTRATNKWSVVGLTALTAMIIDLVLDPAAVALGFWSWPNGGFFYDVPLVNFLGWQLSGFLGGLLLHYLYRTTKPTVQLAYSGIAIVWFWTAVNLWLGNVLPAAIGIAITIILFRNMNQKTVQ